jgi:hypothetical protein
MDLKRYFDDRQGTGVLATADETGHVDVAVYSRPHVMDDGTVALIMADRLSHHHVTQNPHAAFLFKEDGPGYKGIRLFLKKIREDQDPELIKTLRAQRPGRIHGAVDSLRFVVTFQVEKVLPLVGTKFKD